MCVRAQERVLKVKQIGKKLHSFSDARYVHIHIDRYTHSLRNALYAVTHTHIDRYIHTHRQTHVSSFLF